MWKSVKVVLNLEAQVGAASPRSPSWTNRHTRLSAGVLGETALAVAGHAFAWIPHAKAAKAAKEYMGGSKGYRG